jgi:hypothetical protein
MWKYASVVSRRPGGAEMSFPLRQKQRIWTNQEENFPAGFLVLIGISPR